MGTTDFGKQIKSIGFHAPADSGVVNKRNVDVQERGIYSGGYLTKETGNNVSISPLVCIIGDNDYQLRIETTALPADPQYIRLAVPDPVANKYIILRWAHSEATGEDYMDALAVAAINIDPINDLIVGICEFDGFGVLTGFNYADATRTYVRSEANSPARILKVIPTETYSRSVRINQGYINYGTVKKFVPTQTYDLSAAIGAVTVAQLVALYVDENGAIQRYVGTDAATPGDPAYNNKIVLAEVRITPGMTEIKEEHIRDVRLHVGAGINAATLFPSMTGNAGKVVRVNQTETGLEYVDLSSTTKRVLVWSVGYPSVSQKVSTIFTIPWTSGTITKAIGNVNGVPTGAPIIVNIKKNGTTIWSTPSNKLTILAGASSGVTTTFNTTTVAENDIMTMDIDGVGTTSAGTGLTVQLVITT